MSTHNAQCTIDWERFAGALPSAAWVEQAARECPAAVTLLWRGHVANLPGQRITLVDCPHDLAWQITVQDGSVLLYFDDRFVDWRIKQC